MKILYTFTASVNKTYLSMTYLLNKINGWHPVLINILVLSGVTATDFEMGLKVLVLLVTLGYSTWKWVHEVRKKRK